MFGDVVRTHRQRLGLTQEELAARTGVSVRAIGKVEAGRIVAPRPATLRLLADAFGLTGAARERFFQTGAGEETNETTRTTGPAQLPADITAFTGRAEELRRLDALLAGVADQPAAAVVSSVSGTAGVGKTALAVRWAHQSRGQFPDGQLYVNLRGYDPDQPMTAADALARFLTALGVVGQDIPLEVDERAARFRTETADRRILIVLDNASTVEQIRPLLPGTRSCAVVVTSRASLAGLVAVHGAYRLDLDLLPEAEALDLLRRLIGPRVDAESDAAATLAHQCARLPLALRVAAELAVSRATASLADLVAELADQRCRLDLLDAGGDPRGAVRAVFSWSYRHLPPEAARTFRLLGLHPGPDFDRYAAAALAGTGLEQARHTLELLAVAHLVHPVGASHFGMHDLLRAYAVELATAEDAAGHPRAALGRLFDYYLATAAAAMDGLYPAEVHRRPRIPPADVPTPILTDPDTARGWLETELPCLVAASEHTAAHGWYAHTVRLSTTLLRYLDGGYPTDALVVHGHARDAARHSGDPVGEAQALTNLGCAHFRLGRYGPAVDHHGQALDLFRQAGDRIGEARTLGHLGLVEQWLGRHGQATDHFERALALFRQAGDRIGEARALTSLGAVEEALGRHGQATDHHEQAVALFRQAGDRSGEASALSNLGMSEAALGRHGQGIDHQEQALALFRQLGDRSGVARGLDNLGIIHARLGQPDRAAEYYLRALTLLREFGERDDQAWPLNGLGEAALASDQPDTALNHHTAALAIAADTGARDQQARAHAGLGHAHLALADPARAREQYEHALALYTDLGMPNADQVRADLATLTQPTPATTTETDNTPRS